LYGCAGGSGRPRAGGGDVLPIIGHQIRGRFDSAGGAEFSARNLTEGDREQVTESGGERFESEDRSCSAPRPCRRASSKRQRVRCDRMRVVLFGAGAPLATRPSARPKRDTFAVTVRGSRPARFRTSRAQQSSRFLSVASKTGSIKRSFTSVDSRLSAMIVSGPRTRRRRPRRRAPSTAARGRRTRARPRSRPSNPAVRASSSAASAPSSRARGRRPLCNGRERAHEQELHLLVEEDLDQRR
jgi:hypothetical protein